MAPQGTIFLPPVTFLDDPLVGIETRRSPFNSEYLHYLGVLQYEYVEPELREVWLLIESGGTPLRIEHKAPGERGEDCLCPKNWVLV